MEGAEELPAQVLQVRRRSGVICARGGGWGQGRCRRDIADEDVRLALLVDQLKDVLGHLVATFENGSDRPAFEPVAQRGCQRRLIEGDDPVPQVAVHAGQLVHHVVTRCEGA